MIKPSIMKENEQSAARSTRRNFMASLGITGLASVSDFRMWSANPLNLGGKTDPLQDLYDLIGDPQQFRTEEASVIDKVKLEFIDRAVNLKWYGAKGDGVTDDSAAWNAAIQDVPSGGALYVPPSNQPYYSEQGFVCDRDNITIFGSGQGSCLRAGVQKNTLLLGSLDRTTKRRNIKVHSMKFSQTAGPSGSGRANNFAGLKCWYVDDVVITDNDFENCDVGVSLASGHASLGFPGRVGHRNIVVGNRVRNSNKMGIEVFFQDNASVLFNHIINEESYGPAESHGIRLIGSHHSRCIGNDVERFRTGVSNQGGESGGFRSSDSFVIALNTIRHCLIGIEGFNSVFNGKLMLNTIESVRTFGLNFINSKAGNWDNIIAINNVISCQPNSPESSQYGARFSGGGRFVFRDNHSFGFGNGMTSGIAYHVYVDGIRKSGIIEDNYFEDQYYRSADSRNVGVRVFNNATVVISRKNIFISPRPNADEQNIQHVGSTGTFTKGYAGIEDMNDYLLYSDGLE